MPDGVQEPSVTELQVCAKIHHHDVNAIIKKISNDKISLQFNRKDISHFNAIHSESFIQPPRNELCYSINLQAYYLLIVLLRDVYNVKVIIFYGVVWCCVD